MRLDRKILIDTSVMVDLLRGVEMAMNWIDGVEPKNRCMSFITVAELTAGCRNNKDEQKKAANAYRKSIPIATLKVKKEEVKPCQS